MEKIDEDFAVDISLSQLADIAGLSIPHFCRAFRQTTGLPPYPFVIQRRIDRSKEYLRHSDMSVTDIALACGFSSSSHFANTFRREAGLSPLAYRRAT
ncbi:MAG: helix-turn-helix transcriptional regulator [Hoeflea sp.]|nr:helix-turn-helix transcriptional regulator [Hoeflea sp.]